MKNFDKVDHRASKNLDTVGLSTGWSISFFGLFLLTTADDAAENGPDGPREDFSGMLIDRSCAFGYPQLPSPQGSSIPKPSGSATA